MRRWRKTSLGRYLEASIDEQAVEVFYEKAKKKIAIEKWPGRNVELKAINFMRCWISEKAWGGILDDRGIKNEWAGTYVGDVQHAPPNYKVWIKGNQTTLGIRSRILGELVHWREVPYPDDRFRLEKEKIHDYIIVASVDFKESKDAVVRFYGACTNIDLIKVLGTIEPHFSPAQQELFRPVPLIHFNYDLMVDILEKADRV